MNLPTVSFPVAYPDPEMTGRMERGRPVWRLQVDYHYEIDCYYHGVIPAGFEFDYASVPRFFWRMFPPIDPRYSGAALLHDWGYASEWWDKRYTDKLFLAAMLKAGVPWWKRNLMWVAVAAFGNATYRQHTDESVMAARGLVGELNKRRPLYEMAA